MKKLLYVFLVLFVFCVPIHAEETAVDPQPSLWADIWANGAYYTSNGENRNFRGILLRSEGRFGVQVGGQTSAMPYFVYYGVTGQDPNYWNNNLAYGFGVRMTPFTAAETKSWALEWIRDVKLYGEILNLAFIKDGTTATTNKVKTDDFKCGVDIWHEWNLNNIDRKYFWAEMWLRADYRNTNFYDPFTMDKFQTYVGFLQLKIGRHLFGGVRPYIAGYLSTSGSRVVWLNSLYYGLGIRMEPFRELEGAPSVLRKFKMFVEALKISWLADQDPTRPTSDIRFGIEYTYGR